MKRRIIAILLVLATVLGMFPTALAASSEDEALGEVGIYHNGQKVSYLSINGRVREQTYTYYNYVDTDGASRQVPAYCVNPNTAGVPQTVPAGTSIKYMANEKASDPKVFGIVASGYPHRSLEALGLSNVNEGYYATKMALWCHILPNWDISDLTVNPAADQAAAQRVLKAAKEIYQTGMYWNSIKEPHLTVTADQETAYPVTVDGTDYLQQEFTVWSETWVDGYAEIAFADPGSVPDGTRIVGKEGNDITGVYVTDIAEGGGWSGIFKVLYPAASVEGKSGSDNIRVTAKVHEFAIFYAVCAEKNQYGEIQNYMVDTDPRESLETDAIARYTSDPDAVPPDNPPPENPPPENPPPENPPPEEPPEPGILRIVKVESGTEIPLDGAVFKVVGPNGDTIGRFSTNANGEIEIPNAEPGNYTIYEQTPPKNHLLSNFPTQNVTVKEGETATVTFENNPYGELRIEKVSDTGEGLSGVRVQIKHIESGRTYSGATEAGGFIQFTDLQPGAYEVMETAGIKGWQVDVNTIKNVTVVTGQISTVTFTNKELPGLRIEKYDSSNNQVLSGITFRIWRDGELLDDYRTGEMGEILLTDLQPGTYLIQEIASDDGHVLDPTPQQVELHAGDGIKQVVFFNGRKPGIHLIKVDSVTMASLPNVRFEFKKVGGSFRKEFTTDINGEIDLSKLDLGSYEVRELEAPDGYLIDDAVRVIQLNPNENAEFVFTNTPKPDFELIKYDPNTGKYLPGATFRIAKIEDGSHYLDRITDMDGKIRIDDLEPGVYSVKEMDPPPGYVKVEREFHVELFPGKLSKLVVDNEAKPDLKIVKVDAVTGEPVQGVTFTVKKPDSSTITTEATDANGEILIEDLDPGVIEVWEHSVPDGYIIDTEHQMVTLVPNRTATVHFKNYQKPKLTISKVDIDGKPLAGAVFEVKTKAGVKIGDFPVDSSGKILVPSEHLLEGYYIITEKQAPTGYILDPTPHEVYLRPGRNTEVSIENEKKPGLTIKKIDSVVGDGVEGAKFELWVAKDKTENGTYQKLDDTYYYTDKNGIIHIDNLDTGWYKVKEVEPPAGFMLKDPSEQTIYVEHDKTATVTFENIPKSALIIRKIDGETGAPLANAWFRIRYLGGTSGSGGTIIGEYQTSSNGNIVLTGLDAGTYVVEEINAPNGYVMDIAPQTAYISGKEQDCITLTFTNSKYGSLLIKKIDSITKAPLSDVRFFVTDSDGSVVGSGNGYFTTDAAGTILIGDIKPGTTLVVKEVETRPGYILDDVPQTVKITSNETKVLEFRNQPKGGLIVRKIDSATGKPIASVEFKITNANGELLPDNEGMTSSNGMYTTDANGQIVLPKLSPGTYIVTETKTLDDYILDATPQTVVVNASDTQTLTFTNTPKGALVVWKYDSVTGEAVKGAVFQIKNITAGTGGTVVGTYKTTANGSFTVTGLDAGTYVVEEIASDSGHVIDTSPQTVTISGDKKEVIHLYFGNSPKGNLLIKKIDSITREPLSDVEFLVTNSDGSTLGTSGGRYVTDSAGSILVEGIAPGTTLIVKETRAREGYVLDDTPQTAVIKAGQTVELEFRNQPCGSLLIRKVCSVNPSVTLANAEFKVAYSDGSLVGSSNGIYRSDENGEVRIDGLIPGRSVVVTETKAPAGFLIDTQSQTVEIQAGRPVSLTFKNQPMGQLIVQKRDSATNQPLPGAESRVPTAAGCEVGLDGVIGTSTLTQNGLFTTDSNGEIRITNLAPGAYVLTEIKAPDGYVMDSPSTNVVIGTNGDTQTIIIKNSKAGVLVIDKRDSVTNKPLEGVTFKVTTATGEYVPDANGQISSNGLYITDKEGKITIHGVVGTLVVTETKTIPGYTIDPTTQTQTVVVNPNDTQTLHFYNTPGTTLVIRKFIEGTENEPLSGVAFKVMDSSGAAVGPDDGIYYTDKAGEIILNGIEPGTTVTAWEIKTVEGFVLDGTPQDILIKAGEVQQLVFWNQRDCSLTILKQSTAKEPLTGAVFHVTDEDGAAIGTNNGRYTTDRNGLITITGLQPGQVLIVTEEKAPNGYVKDPTPKTIRIKQGTANSLTFENAKTGCLIINKRSSADKRTPLEGVTFKITTTNGSFLPDADGKISSNGLYYTDENGQIILNSVVGSIVVTEMQTIDGYTIHEANRTQTVEVAPDDTQTLYFSNAPLCSLTIRKLDSVTGKPVPGTEFTVKDGNGGIIGRYTTGTDGTVTVTGLVPGSTVVVSESKVPSGYVLNTTPQTITVRSGSNSITSGGSSSGSGTGGSSGTGTGGSGGNHLDFENDPTTTLVIQKIEDSAENEPMQGVEFLVTDGRGAPVGPDNGRYVTDRDGRITIPGLEPGTAITARETRTLPGFILDTAPQTIQIKVGEAQTLTFRNKRAGNLIIKKLDASSHEPLAGVEFKVTYSDGSFVDTENGTVSSKGLYTTDRNGEITLSGITGSIVITETRTIDGYTINENERSQTVQVNANDTQTVTFYNAAIGGLELIKVNEADKSQRIPGVTFEIRKMDGALVDTITTGDNGRAFQPLDAGDYYLVETECPKEYKLDPTPHYFTVNESGVTTVTVTNKAFSGILIHKIDSATRKGIYGVTFLLYDGNHNPMDQFTTDQNGYAYVNTLELSGKVYLRELENKGYKVDEQLKTVYVKPGETTEITWENTAVSGQIQITKKSADYNATNGLPAGTLLEGAVFEIYDKASNLVDTIKSDSRGLAVSRLLPLGRYTIRETKAPANYGVSGTDLTAYLEHEGQILRFEVTNKSMATGVSITKTGPKEAMAGQPVRYAFSGIANSSNVRLDSFYWRDKLPAQVRLESVVTGTYNFPGTYKITYRVNGGEPQTLADNLSTSKNYTLAASSAALGLASDERVTEIMFVFGQAPAGFAQVEKPYLHCKAVSGLKPESFVNIADVGGTYEGVWVQAVSRWVTAVYGKPTPLPRTGY